MLQPTQWIFQDKYLFKVVEQFEEPVYTDLINNVLGGTPEWTRLLSEEELKKQQELKSKWKPSFRLRIAAYFGEELVGCTSGWQSEENTYYMAISLVRPDHQRCGLYSELLRAVISFAQAEGFQKIQSHHQSSNNPILIAKLKAGFVIGGLELTDTMGSLVSLVYFLNSERRKFMDARTGFVRPTGLIRDLFF